MPEPRPTRRHAGRPNGGAVLVVTAPVLTATPVLLGRMRRDLERDGRLRAGTAAWMWTGYAAHAALLTTAFARRPTSPPLPAPARAAALALTGAGSALLLAGFRRFAGPAQLTGTDAGPLVTGGAYRYSRNPQYTGAVAALTGAAAARRSPAALALTAALAAVYRAWVPTEERHLTHHFGAPYRDYHARTPRWLGRPTVVDP